MKKILFFAAFVVAFTFALAPISCGNSDKDNDKDKGGKCTNDSPKVKVDTALNITIYLDLSDRLVRDLTPSQTVRDTSIVSHIAKIFKNESLGPQLLNTRNRLKVMFYPTPNNSEIATIAGNLNVDLAAINVRDRKATLQTIDDKFKKGLEQVYAQTIQDQNWQGSDIWGFFDKKAVDQHCIMNGVPSRNILVILTDGYIFDENNRRHEGNAYNYILPQNLDTIDSLITTRKGFGNLEVLMLEINPYQQAQRPKMISLLEKWFRDMGVSNFVVADTDLPTNTNTIIDNFFNARK